MARSLKGAFIHEAACSFTKNERATTEKAESLFLSLSGFFRSFSGGPELSSHTHVRQLTTSYNISSRESNTSELCRQPDLHTYTHAPPHP